MPDVCAVLLLRHLLVWCALSLLALAGSSVWSDSAERVRAHAHWMQAIERSFDPDPAREIVLRARRQAQALMARPEPPQPVRQPAARAPSLDPARGVAATSGLELALLRLHTALAWWPVLLPVWAAAAVQGAVLRRVRRGRFAAIDPSRQRRWLHLGIAGTGATVCALMLPRVVPLAVLPALGVLLAACIVGALAHHPRWRG
jgi:hypothetical protein